MEALLLILVGLITGFEAASSQPRSEDIEPNALPEVIECVMSDDALRITNLKDPAAPIWVLQPDESVCDPATGRTVVVGDLEDLRGS